MAMACCAPLVTMTWSAVVRAPRRRSRSAIQARSFGEPSGQPYCSAAGSSSARWKARPSARRGNCAAAGSPPASPTTPRSAAARRISWSNRSTPL